MNSPLDRLKYHVTDAIERGEKEPVTEVPNLPRYAHTELAGQLMNSSWPGMYPLFYMDWENSVMCPACARKSEKENAHLPQFLPIACDTNYEDAELFCDECNERIPSAYAEDETNNEKEN